MTSPKTVTRKVKKFQADLKALLGLDFDLYTCAELIDKLNDWNDAYISHKGSHANVFALAHNITNTDLGIYLSRGCIYIVSCDDAGMFAWYMANNDAPKVKIPKV